MSTMEFGKNLPENVQEILLELSELTGEPVEAISEEMLRKYLAWLEEDDADLQESIAAADRGEFATDEEMEELFARYGA